MITKDCVEAAYCFFHQKWRIYASSTIATQRDDIEYAVASYVDDMNKNLYAMLANGAAHFLTDHTSFSKDMPKAIEKLESMMQV